MVSADYFNTWLKLKQQSAGWPSWCQTLEQKHNYILHYQERKGIRLEISRIAKNPGRKATARLLLNRYTRSVFLFFIFRFTHSHDSFFGSFWGKLGERVNKPPLSPSKIHLICSAYCPITPSTSVPPRLCTNDILEAVYTSVHDSAVKGTKTNIFIAAFTACDARLKLNESLDALQEQVLYYDTNSVVYKWRPDQPFITTGDFLGDMTAELNGRHHRIRLGWCQKLRLHDKGGKSGLQCLWIHLECSRFGCPQFLHHERQHLAELDNPQDHRRTLDQVTPYYFQRDLEQKRIKVIPCVKHYGLVFEKCVINTNTKSSYPYGYERIGEEVDILLDL